MKRPFLQIHSLMEVELQRAAPGGEARGEGNVSANALGAIHRIVEEEF